MKRPYFHLPRSTTMVRQPTRDTLQTKKNAANKKRTLKTKKGTAANKETDALQTKQKYALQTKKMGCKQKSKNRKDEKRS